MQSSLFFNANVCFLFSGLVAIQLATPSPWGWWWWVEARSLLWMGVVGMRVVVYICQAIAHIAQHTFHSKPCRHAAAVLHVHAREPWTHTPPGILAMTRRGFISPGSTQDAATALQV